MKHKLKRIFKRVVPLVLVCTLTIGAVLGHNTKEVKALTGVEEAALVTAILLAYGYVTTRYFNDTDGANALKNDMEQAYEETRFKVLNGGASGGGGDEDPDDNDFEDTDGDGKITEKDIPQFKDISLSEKAAFALSANTALLLSPIVSKFIKNQYGKNDLSSTALLTDVNNKVSDYISTKNLPRNKYQFYLKKIRKRGTFLDVIVTYTNNAYCYLDGNYLELRPTVSSNPGITILLTYNNGVLEKIGHNTAGITGESLYLKDSDLLYYNHNLPYSPNGQRVDWVTPDLESIFDNNGNLELLPPYSPNFNYNMPTQQALQELLNNLQSPGLDPISQKQLVLDYINNLKTEVTPAPDPSPDPKPEPSPDPKPEPNPNPEPSPEPNPEPGENEDNGKFTADLKTLFPFCIPFDLVDCFKLFNAEPETPRIEVPMHFGIIDVDYTWVIDLKDFDSVAVICRSMFLILFLIGLALATSKVIKW